MIYSVLIRRHSVLDTESIDHWGDSCLRRNDDNCLVFKGVSRIFKCQQIREKPEIRGVAQPGSALAWGARGRGFKSRRPDHFKVDS